MAARLLARLLVPVLVAAVSMVAAAPARACACGALLSNDPRLSVSGETSIVRWDGAHEEITLGLSVDSVRPDAALLLPTPAPVSRPRTVGAGVFDALAEMSAPRTRTVEDWWPAHLFDPGPMGGAPAATPPTGGPDVTVNGQTDVGPYHVASLSARDPRALARWLKANGYRMKGTVAAELAPYVKMGWHYTAVRLRATSGGTDAAATRLEGMLTPLRVGFATRRPVYPMRLSHAITADQHVRLYVIGAHRMAPESGGIGFTTTYAGRPGARGGLFAGGTPYLTTLDGTARPGAVNDDVRLARVADRPYVRTVTRTEPVYILGVAGGPFLVALGLLVVIVLAAAVLVVVQRVRRAGRRSVHTGSSAS